MTRDAVIRRVRIAVPLANVGAAVHACDNLLLVHAPQAKLCFVYDIKESDLSHPVAPPLPLDATVCV